MNRVQRAQLDSAIALLERSYEIIIKVRDEEKESFDNMPKDLQDADKGSEMLINIRIMEAVEHNLDNLISDIGDVGVFEESARCQIIQLRIE